MNTNINIEKTISNLTPAIEDKCEEIKAQRKEKFKSRIFAILCVLTVIIPTLLVLLGISLTMFILPIIITSLSVVMLLPILINNEGAKNYEQV